MAVAMVVAALRGETGDLKQVGWGGVRLGLGWDATGCGGLGRGKTGEQGEAGMGRGGVGEGGVGMGRVVQGGYGASCAYGGVGWAPGVSGWV